MSSQGSGGYELAVDYYKDWHVALSSRFRLLIC
jgi:hypothetical protein